MFCFHSFWPKKPFKEWNYLLNLILSADKFSKDKNEKWAFLFVPRYWFQQCLVGYGSVPVTSDLLTSSCRLDLCCMGSICIQMDHSMGELNPSACMANLRFWPRIIWSFQWWGYEFVQFDTFGFETLFVSRDLWWYSCGHSCSLEVMDGWCNGSNKSRGVCLREL